MKKLSFVICARTNGGHEIQAIKLANSFARYFDSSLFTNKFIINDKKISENLKLNIIDFEICAKGNLLNQIIHSYKVSNIDNLIKKIAENEIIIISAGAVEASIPILFALLRQKKSKIKIILYLPFFFDRKLIWPYPLGNIYNKILGLILKKFTRIITINHLNKKIIEKISLKPVNVVSNKIDLIKLKYPAKTARPRLVFIGRLQWQKRIIELIKWLNHKEIPIKELLIIGDGPQFNIIKKLSKKLLNINIQLTGWLSQEKQSEILRKNDILVINSIIEGDPLIVAESLSREIKCISRNINSLRPLIHKDYLFDNQNDLIKVLKRIIKENPKTYFSKNKFIFHNRSEQVRQIANLLNKL